MTANSNNGYAVKHRRLRQYEVMDRQTGERVELCHNRNQAAQAASRLGRAHNNYPRFYVRFLA